MVVNKKVKSEPQIRASPWLQSQGVNSWRWTQLVLPFWPLMNTAERWIYGRWCWLTLRPRHIKVNCHCSFPPPTFTEFWTPGTSKITSQLATSFNHIQLKYFLSNWTKTVQNGFHTQDLCDFARRTMLCLQYHLLGAAAPAPTPSPGELPSLLQDASYYSYSNESGPHLPSLFPSHCHSLQQNVFESPSESSNFYFINETELQKGLCAFS